MARKTGRVSNEDWFRSADWSAAAKAEFEARLARARPHNRVQYRRIKAVGLLRSGDGDREAAGYAILAGIARDEDAPHHEKVGALSLMGAHDQERGRLHEAESNLRAALEAMKAGQSGNTELEEIRLAEVLLALDGRDHLEEARHLLEERAQKPPRLVSSRFRLCVAATRVCMALGLKQEAAGWAAAASKLATAEHSGLANHPTLGLVQTDHKTREWLAAVARGLA